MAEARGTTESVEEIQANASAIMTTDHMHALKYNYRAGSEATDLAAWASNLS